MLIPDRFRGHTWFLSSSVEPLTLPFLIGWKPLPTHFDIIGHVPSLPTVNAVRGLVHPQPGSQRYLPTLSFV